MQNDKNESEVNPDIVETVKSKLNKVMFRMYQEFPFWAFLVEKCKLFITPANGSVQTAAVNAKGNIYFNEKFALECSDSMMHFTLSHEIMHLLLGHFHRVGSRDPTLWNISGDILINYMLKEHFEQKGIFLNMSNFCTAEVFGIDIPNDLITEEIYDVLGQNEKKNLEISKKNNEKGESDMLTGAGAEPKNSVCIRENSEETPLEEKAWSEAGLESATRARMAGNCPAFMERIVDSLNNPKLDWHQILAYNLRQRFCQNTKNRHTFTPPNRRYLYQDIVITSRIGTKKPSLAFSIDTSGSMSENDIKAGISEMDAIRKLYKVPLYLIECDHTVHKARWIFPYDQIPQVIGGGGTSFVPIMDHIKDNKIDIDVLVLFTDGYGEFGNAPDFDVISVITSDVKAPYGKTIKV